MPYTNSIILIVAGILFFLHLISETLASFIKYNFSSIGKHMQGVSFSNIFGIASRGFISLYGVVAAVVIEKKYSDVFSYSLVMSMVLFFSSYISYFYSNKKISRKSINETKKNISLISDVFFKKLDKNDTESAVKIKGVVSVFLGVQFVAIVVAYGFCFLMPDRRLFIISLVPLVGMLGTMATVVLVEPRLAIMIDMENSTGFAASKEFLRARAISFAFSALLIAFFPFGMKFIFN